MQLLLILIAVAGCFGLAVIGVFLYSMRMLKRSGGTVFKVLAAVTGGILLLVVLVVVWRAADVAFSPKAVLDENDSFVFEGHTYVLDNFDEFPYDRDLKPVALVRYPSESGLVGFLSDMLFPSRLYREQDAADMTVLWERGLMLESKYRRTD